ncbi:hypothetical protein ACIGHG_18670 [Bacillus sp. NPDC077411]|uniref:Uncharacterized protein n=1 Tax=Bacillus bruguierae TaxID=3127667 RepID=A0ABU8FMN3_9BACI|nr:MULTISPECIES: hypothetical protein [unclassified Bacillus (in: firmicutes)]MDC2864402.1 hypothetical protein [Bacillus sp. BP-3]SFI73050.1 hypothetical protein SAMN04488574_104114 [Bacillus sp. 71mf]SFS88431.1 hypothetical protein SAMN04488145_104252 [Bacillus sp. 103mf]
MKKYEQAVGLFYGGFFMLGLAGGALLEKPNIGIFVGIACGLFTHAVLVMKDKNE